MLKQSWRTVAISTATFLLGLCLQVLFERLMGPSSSEIWVLIIILVCWLVVLLFQSALHSKFDKVDDDIHTKFDTFGKRLQDIIDRIGINVEYLEDGADGKSYRKSTELVESAKKSLTFVGNWDLFSEYHVASTSVNEGESVVISARKQFYETVNKMVVRHQSDDKPFYRRIIQLKEEYINQRAPFETDPVFFDHLQFVARLLENRSRACILRKTTYFMNIQFTIIDERYIIIPIFTTIKNMAQARYGALIIDDTSQRFVERLQSIYWALEAHAKPIDPDQLRINIRQTS